MKLKRKPLFSPIENLTNKLNESIKREEELENHIKHLSKRHKSLYGSLLRSYDDLNKQYRISKNTTPINYIEANTKVDTISPNIENNILYIKVTGLSYNSLTNKKQVGLQLLQDINGKAGTINTLSKNEALKITTTYDKGVPIRFITSILRPEEENE